MHPCFWGLVLNVVLDVFLPLIGVWLEGERWQLGETALPLMNSSSSILPKRPVDTPSLPVKKTSLPCLGPHGQPPVFLTLHATALNLLLRALLLLWLQVLYLRTVNFALFLNDPHVAFPKSGFNYLILASYWLSPMKWRPCCLLCSWSTKGHYLSLVLSPGRVYNEMKIVLFQGCVTVRGFNCSFAKGIPIINI